MKTKSKVLLLIVSALALVIATIFGTLAYLTDIETVTNTFTVGHVDIILNEAKVNEDGTVVANADRVAENKYHLIPGHTYTKDPTVTVIKGSEMSYVRMKVTVKNYNGLTSAIPYKDGSKYYGVYGDENIFLLQELCGGWDKDVWKFAGFELSQDGTTATYEFRYKDVVGKWHGSTEDEQLAPLFKTITLPGDLIGNDEMDKIAGVEITVVAHAMQADGFEYDENGAWEAFGNSTSQYGEKITKTTTAVNP